LSKVAKVLKICIFAAKLIQEDSQQNNSKI
jgi:hypothetical protein